MTLELGYTTVHINDELKKEIEYFKNYKKVLILVGSKAISINEKFKERINFYHKNNLNFEIIKYFRTNPSVKDVRNLCKIISKEKYDCVIGIGGGSTIDLIKATKHSLERNADIRECLKRQIKKTIDNKFDFFTIPTTSGSGSHVSKYFVITVNKKKFGQVDWSCVPIVSFIDLDFLVLMPRELTVGCGFDVFSHCFESIISKAATPISTSIALEGLRRAIHYLPLVIKDLRNKSFRKEMAIADTMAGISESFAMVDTLHAISQPLNVICNIPHGYANLIIFPHWLKYLEDNSKIPELKEKLNLISQKLNLSNKQLFPFLRKFAGFLSLLQPKPKIHLTKNLIKWLVKTSFETMQIAYDLSLSGITSKDVVTIYKRAFL